MSKAYIEGKETRFVIVDDDTITCFVCEKIIAKIFKQPEIIYFSNPVEALRFFKTFQKDEMVQTVIFIDLNMPVLNGWDLIKEMKNLDEEVKQELLIFILSSSMDPSDISKGKTDPFLLGYFIKPLSEDHLQEVMEFTKLMLC